MPEALSRPRSPAHSAPIIPRSAPPKPGPITRTLTYFVLLACALQGAASPESSVAPAQPAPSSGADSSPSPDPALERSLAAEVERYVEADRTAAPASCQVLFVGSSSIVKWKPTLAADMAPLPVIDRGFGGSHIERVDRWFGELIAPYRPRAVVFYAGENDRVTKSGRAWCVRRWCRTPRPRHAAAVRALQRDPPGRVFRCVALKCAQEAL